MKPDQAKLINYDYQAHVHYPRMPKEKTGIHFSPVRGVIGV